MAVDRWLCSRGLGAHSNPGAATRLI